MTTDSFRNWQAKYIEQSQSSSTTMLGLSGGALAFSTSLLDGGNVYIGYCPSVLFHFHGVLQLLAMGTAIWFAVNRSRDFSLTTRIARLREKDIRDPSLVNLRKESRRLGLISRRLMFWQGIFFLAAAMIFIAFVLVKDATVLYPH